MDGHARLLLKYTGQVKRRSVNGAGNVVEHNALAHSRGQVRLRSLDAFSMIDVRALSFRLTRNATLPESGFEHVSDELQRSHVSPQRFKRIRFCRLKTLHEFPMAPKHPAVARSGHKEKRLIRMIVNRRIEFADNVVEDAWRNREDGPSIAAVSRMTDAISRISREEHGLVHIGGDCSAAEVSRESTVTHQHDVVDGRLFLCAGTTARNVTAVIVHTNDLTLVQRPENQFFIVSHECYYMPQRGTKSTKTIKKKTITHLINCAFLVAFSVCAFCAFLWLIL